MQDARSWSRRDWQMGLTATASALFYGGCEKFLDKIRNRPIRRNVESAAAADDIATYKAAVTAMMPPNRMVPIHGVRNLGCTLEKARGSRPSRAMEKKMRVWP